MMGTSESIDERDADVMAGIADVYPLTPVQHAIVVHALQSPNTGVYLSQVVHALRGPLDVDRLQRAWEAVTARHAVLRTAFAWEEIDEPVQIVFEETPVDLQVLDWSDADPDQREELLERLLLQQRSEGFDLREAPLVRLVLIRFEREAWRLCIVSHHAILDGWSTSLLFKEVLEHFASEGSRILPAEPSFKEFVRLQRRTIDHAFWHGYLADLPSPTLLTGVVERGGVPGFETTTNSVDAGTLGQLTQLARASATTLGTVLQAAWGLMLGRLTGSNDVVFGVTVSGRRSGQHRLEELVGNCINTLPTRIRIDDDADVRTWLSAVHQSIVQLHAHEHAALTSVQRASELPLGTQLFDSILVVENFPSATVSGDASGLSFEGCRVIEHNNFPITLVAETSHRLTFTLNFDREQISGSAARSVLAAYIELLRGICIPFVRLHELGATGATTLASKAAASPALVPAEFVSVLARFSERVKARGDSEAARCGDEALSYLELEREANRWASVLKDLGVGPEVRVGLCVERGLKVVTGILGILKAGGAYVPLDPMYPADRLRFMAHDAGVSVLLTETAHAALWDGFAAPIVCWETLPGTATAGSTEPLAVDVAPEQLAYVIYTSGSTGRPKGSLVTHANLSRLFLASEAEYDFSSSDVWTLFHSYSFDFSVWELWGALLYGGRLVVVPYWTARLSEAFYDLLERERVTVLNQTPTAFVSLMQVDEARNANLALRYVIFGGEALDPSVLTEWMARRGDERPRLINMYGITETTVHVTYRRLCRADLKATSLIGFPLNHLRVHVLDRELRRLPSGIRGELYVSGTGVSRGYQARPELTAERFVPDPFGSGRLYRTGDLGRFREHGELEYLGRADNQVKIRGFRIELGEIEAALRQHPDVINAAVLLDRVAQRDPRLLGYVSSASAALTGHELSLFLRQQLPEYMVPATLVVLGEFPLTQQGKLDRKALLAHLPAAPTAQRVAATPTEALLLQIVSQILGTTAVLGDQNFFELGGHSLLATQLLSRIRRQFQVNLPLRTIFEQPRLATLAKVIDSARREQTLDSPILRAMTRAGFMPLSAAQRGLWIVDKVQPDSDRYNVCAAFMVRGALDAAALNSALTLVIERHEILRTRFIERGDEPWQEVIPFAGQALTVLDAEHVPEPRWHEEAARLAQLECEKPFRLNEAPLVRLMLVRFSATVHAIVMSLHHIVADAWSLDILMRELSTAYRDARAGNSPSLPPLLLQYADYAIWQESRLSETQVERRVQYWTNALADLPAELALPVDRPRDASPGSASGSVNVEVAPETLDRLRSFCVARGVTLHMALLAAFQCMLYRFTRQSDIVVGCPVSGRDRPELEPLIGLFVNTLPFRTRIEENQTFSALVERVRDLSLEAYEHELPLERIVSEVAGARAAARGPLFQVMFALLVLEPDAFRDSDLELKELAVAPRSTKSDLTLSLALTRDRLCGGLEYDAGLFERGTALRMAGQLETLLERVARAPDQPIATAFALGVEDLGLLATLNRSPEAAPPVSTIELLEGRARECPQAIALSCGAHSLTYAELHASAEEFSRTLLSYGVRRGDLVALLLEPTLESVVCMLGIWKARAAYVPLDTALPPARLALLLDDARPKLTLSTADLAAKLAGAAVGTALLVQTYGQKLTVTEATPSEVNARPQPAAESLARRAVGPALPSDLAYVMYTSESTARPEGVQIEQHALANSVLALLREPGMTADDVVLSISPFSIDVSVMDLWVSLAAGARIALLPDPSRNDPPQLLRALDAAAATRLHATPVTWSRLVAEGWSGRPGLIGVSAGEALSASLAGALLERGVDLWNMYGRTETAAFCNLHHVEVAEPWIPIGRPIQGMSTYILDGALEPEPVGVEGELYIGGVGLARGYLNAPQLTAQKFLPNPYGQPGSRLYRTGDRARLLGDGYPRSLGSIHLQRPPRLTTQSGKVARTRHPTSERADAPTNGDARTSTQLELLEETRALLGVGQCSLGDNFFLLGGNSILAIRLVNRLRRSFGVELPQRLVFEAQTLEDLARAIDETMASETPAQRRPVRRTERGPVPASHAQRQMWLLDRLEAASTNYLLPAAVRLSGPLDVDALDQALTHVVARHEALRTVFFEDGSRVMQRVLPSTTFRLRVEDLSDRRITAAEVSPEQRIEASVTAAFDLANEPPFRAELFRLAEHEYVLALTMHHIASDGWSTQLLIRELSECYRARRSAAEPNLPVLPLQYADYAVWQHERLTGAARATLVDYWKGHLSDAPPLLQLPSDRPRPAVRRFRGAAHHFRSCEALTRRIEQLCGELNVTLYMLLLAAFDVLLHRYTGATDLVVGSPIANRSHEEFENLIGFFVNVLVMRVDASGDPAFSELVSRVKATALGAYAHQELPFDVLLDELRPRRDPGYAPLVQVLFAVQNTLDSQMALMDVAMEPLPVMTHGTKYDLTFTVQRMADGMTALVEFDTDMFDSATIERMTEHWHTLLADLVERPTVPISRLMLMTEAEQRSLIANFAGDEDDGWQELEERSIP